MSKSKRPASQPASPPVHTTFDATLDIERVVAGGDGLARHESLVVFVPRALEGERVTARVTVKGRLARAELVSVERASESRVVPQCPHYDADECGGCQIQHATYDEQLRIKSSIVVEAMRRIAHLTVDAPRVRAARSPWRYRHKLTLALRRDGKEWRMGLRRHDKPNEIFAVRDCLITAEPVMAVWSAIRDTLQHLPDAHELRGAVRITDDGAASFALEGGSAWPAAESFFNAVPALRSLWWTPVGGIRRRIGSRDNTASAPTNATESDAVVPDASFAQVNAETAADLRAHVLERVRAHAPRHAIDAYAGSGDSAIALDDAGVSVTAIEMDRDAAQWMAEHLSDNSTVMIDKVENAIDDALRDRQADVVLVNPPRTGLHARVCEAIVRSARPIKAIVYVSCDPATLARDIARLPGWRVASMECFDMFPQTAHVETVCELIPIPA